ncbi:uncharacterized protein Z518_00226 [Rhinocladiella mackenziei CBS 650.93]|uniref:Uncharacterized protein n=1 Tax=Rhinocladiella mackenziei CBS 650.93 TaxID=1442369 RepID=A0A0D2HES2_9EURO|nr:uncharacterized protein Z518_00226 [Rhinocladiella mackenziei CBS 650.93]KIX09148.1 hypothetical protein Z518_00226 [Rhinocladiella mackenziei CBS 650.93]
MFAIVTLGKGRPFDRIHVKTLKRFKDNGYHQISQSPQQKAGGYSGRLRLFIHHCLDSHPANCPSQLDLFDEILRDLCQAERCALCTQREAHIANGDDVRDATSPPLLPKKPTLQRP